MQLRSDSFQPYDRLPERLGFGRPDGSGGIALSANRNPHLAWDDVPDGTRSFALICVDPDAPTVGTHVNQPDRAVSVDTPRGDFFHWVVADLPADLREIAEGAHSDGITARGKASGPTPSGGRAGKNDYTGWFATDADMAGDYFGYDGPCPPFNDERLHGYVFEVLALDVASLSLPASFTGTDLRAAMLGHVLGSRSLMGLYCINPAFL